MGVDFTTSVAWAAAQARQKQLEQERAAAQAQAQMADAGIIQGTQRNMEATASDFEKRQALGRAQAYEQAAAEGQAAGWAGNPTPQYTTDEMNRGAATGAARGGVAMAELVAKRKAALEQAKYEEGLNEKRDRAQAGNKILEEQTKFEHENPITSRQQWYIQQSRNRAAQGRANTMADALTAGTRGTLQKDQVADEMRVNEADTLLAQMDKLPKNAFNAPGIVHRKQEEADQFLQGTPLEGAAGKVLQTVTGGAYQTHTPEETAAVRKFRSTALAFINKQIRIGAGLAQTDHEAGRQAAELGTLTADPNWIMAASDADLRQALITAKDIAARAMAVRGRVLGNNSTLGPRAGGEEGAHAPAGYAPPPWEALVEPGPEEDMPVGMGGVSDDGRDVQFGPPGYVPPNLGPAPVPQAAPQAAAPPQPAAPPPPTNAVQAAKPIVAKAKAKKAKTKDVAAQKEAYFQQKLKELGDPEKAADAVIEKYGE